MKKKKAIESNPKVTQMLELEDKDIKTVITIFCMFKKFSKNMDNIKDKNQILR